MHVQSSTLSVPGPSRDLAPELSARIRRQSTVGGREHNHPSASSPPRTEVSEVEPGTEAQPLKRPVRRPQSVTAGGHADGLEQPPSASVRMRASVNGVSIKERGEWDISFLNSRMGGTDGALLMPTTPLGILHSSLSSTALPSTPSDQAGGDLTRSCTIMIVLFPLVSPVSRAVSI